MRDSRQRVRFTDRLTLVARPDRRSPRPHFLFIAAGLLAAGIVVVLGLLTGASRAATPPTGSVSEGSPALENRV